MSQNKTTLEVYSSIAPKYISDTLNMNVSPLQKMLTNRLAPGAHILDAGCGSGRDSKAFLEQGFKVSAFDGCAEFAQHTSTLLGQPVAHMLFEDLTVEDAYDGIWASASLLHLDDEQLSKALQNLFRALKADGLFFASFKVGEGYRVDDAGRFFNDMTEARLTKFLVENGGEIVEISTTADLQGRAQGWLAVLCRKSAAAASKADEKKEVTIPVALGHRRPEVLGFYLLQRETDPYPVLAQVVHPLGSIWHVDIGGERLMFKSIRPSARWSARLDISQAL